MLYLFTAAAPAAGPGRGVFHQWNHRWPHCSVPIIIPVRLYTEFTHTTRKGVHQRPTTTSHYSIAGVSYVAQTTAVMYCLFIQENLREPWSPTETSPPTPPLLLRSWRSVYTLPLPPLIETSLMATSISPLSVSLYTSLKLPLPPAVSNGMINWMFDCPCNWKVLRLIVPGKGFHHVRVIAIVETRLHVWLSLWRHCMLCALTFSFVLLSFPVFFFRGRLWSDKRMCQSPTCPLPICLRGWFR